MARIPLLAGNWKMYKTGDEAVSFIETLKPLLPSGGREAALGVPATALAQAARAAQGSSLIIGAQNLHWENEGAYTGEISAAMIKGAGATMVILGHSERRQFFADTDEWVSKKLKTALDNDLLPIVCIGESLVERESGLTFEILARQLDGGLSSLSGRPDAQKLVLAYEPVWAIGTGKTASVDQAQEAHAFIRKHLAKTLGEVAQKVRILYGGSVKPDNVSALMSQPDIDGALVGGASLVPDSFAKIVNFA